MVKSYVQIMTVIYTYLTEIMQLSFRYLNQESQILMIDNRDKKTTEAVLRSCSII